MQAALLYGREDLRLETVDDPVPDAGEVGLKVRSATTCGTDLKVWRRGGHARMLTLPTLFGHEAAGEIVAIAKGVTNWNLGDRVVANNSAPCFDCFYCDREAYSLCENLTWNNGTFAEYLKVPAAIVRHNLLRIPEGTPDEIASLTEPLACVLHGAARSSVRKGDRVVVLGDGAIGLMFVAVLVRHYRAKVILFGGRDDRLEIGKTFGADSVLNYHKLTADVPEIVRELTEGRGADAAIEATGVPQAWETAIACVRPGATVNLFGGCPRNTQISVATEPLHYSELTIKGVFHNTPGFVREALQLLASGTIPFEFLLSDRRPLKALETAFRDMGDRKAIKVAIDCG